MAHIKPCWKCGSDKIKVWDCGYSSFNVGGVKCERCGHEVKLDICGCFPHDELVRKWNGDNQNFKEQTAELEHKLLDAKRLLNGDSPMIDAKSARLKSDDWNKNEVKKMLDSIDIRISDAVEAGKFSISEGYLRPEVISYLQKLGYEIEDGVDRNESWTNIKW